MSTKSRALSGFNLLAAYAENPSLLLRNKIVQENAGLVRQVAHHYAHRSKEPYEDLQQVGYLGLIRAIEKYKSNQGYTFSSFAIPSIRGEILHYLRDKVSTVRIPRKWQELHSKGNKVRKQLILALGKQPHEYQVAEALGISWQQWNECLLVHRNCLMVSLDANLAQNTDGQITLVETLADPKIAIEQKQAEEAEDRLQLQKAIHQLEKNSRIAIEQVYLQEVSRKEVAGKIGISPMSVTRYLKKGIEDLGVLLEHQAA